MRSERQARLGGGARRVQRARVPEATAPLSLQNPVVVAVTVIVFVLAGIGLGGLAVLLLLRLPR